jgi:hypothetical protein
MSTVATHPGFVPPHPFFDFNDAPARIERRHDKDELRNRLLDQLEAVLIYLFPNGKRQGTRFVVGNVQGDAGDSLVIELEGPKRGVWIDFATGESGDVLALWAAVRGFAVPRDFGELLDDVGDWLVVPTSFTPAPAKSSAAHDTLGPHTGKWDYRSAAAAGLIGELLALRVPLRHTRGRSNTVATTAMGCATRLTGRRLLAKPSSSGGQRRDRRQVRQRSDPETAGHRSERAAHPRSR